MLLGFHADYRRRRPSFAMSVLFCSFLLSVAELDVEAFGIHKLAWVSSGCGAIKILQGRMSTPRSRTVHCSHDVQCRPSRLLLTCMVPGIHKKSTPSQFSTLWGLLPVKSKVRNHRVPQEGMRLSMGIEVPGGGYNRDAGSQRWLDILRRSSKVREIR